MSVIKFPEFPVLVVDDEKDALLSFEITLNSGGIDNVVLCQDSRKVLTLLSSCRYEMILLDLTMPHFTGEELLSIIVQDFPEIPVIIITGDIEVDTAVRCMKKDAFDYLVKPVEEDRLISVVRRVIERNQLQRENQTLKHQLVYGDLNHPEAFSSIITRNSTMISILKYIEVIAKSQEPVLITGETGVGKELVARAIHTLGERKGAFISINVAGLDDNMFSDTLFGHQKGAFTDAHQSRGGLIDQASEGTLFLDEIGDLSLTSQIKLLRLLQEHEYFSLGSDLPKYSNAHVITSTNKDLKKSMESGQFRKDLYYRMEVHHVHIPTLPQRKDDIPLLVECFLKEAANTYKKKKPTPPMELFILLENYSFPGNIRELRSMIYNAVSAHNSGILSMESFKKNIKEKKRGGVEQFDRTKLILGSEFQNNQPLPTLKQAELFLIKEAMKKAKGNQSVAAQLLGITRQTLNKKLKFIN